MHHPESQRKVDGALDTEAVRGTGAEVNPVREMTAFRPVTRTPDHLLLEVHGNPNVLTRDLKTSRLSQGPAVTTRVELERFTGEAPPVRAFQPPVSAEVES